MIASQAAEAEDAGELVDLGDVGLGERRAVLDPGQGQRRVAPGHHALDRLPVAGAQTRGEAER